MLITVVGGDGAGKSTLSRLVAQRMTEQGHRVGHAERWDIVANPEYPSARLLAPDVPAARACVAEMPNQPRFLFLIWSIAMSLLGRRSPDAAGTLTVLDGYWMKHAAAEIAYGLDPKWAESVVGGLPQADLVVYLRLDPENAWSRKQDGDLIPYECGMDEGCTRDSFVRHQRRIIAILDDWSRRYGWMEIDAFAPLDAVVDIATATIRTALHADARAPR